MQQLACVSRDTCTVLSYANDGVGTNQLDEAVSDRALGVTLSIGLNVAEITNVAGLVGGGTVSLAVGVDCGRDGVLDMIVCTALKRLK